MVSVRKLLDKGADLLKKSDIDSYRLDSRILLASIMNLSMEDVILAYDNEVSEDIQREFLDLISRRQKREPIAYIAGIKEFYGMDFLVDSNVLIPRPDSENLVEGVLQHFDKEILIDVLELGSGSGCLILSILKHMKNASGIAVDIKGGAINIAKKNCKKLGLENQVEFIKSDWSDLKIEKKFDLIISNPPYITSQEMMGLQEDVRRYEPNIALEAGEDGLEAYRSLAPILRNSVKQNGIIALEFGEGQRDEVLGIMIQDGFSLDRVIKDLSGKDRCMFLKKVERT